MLEIPESQTLARQMNETIKGKTIKTVTAAQSPHKFAFYFENPEDYHDMLKGACIDYVGSFGGQVEIFAGDKRILFMDGANIRYFEQSADIPKKHQLLIRFEDETYFAVTVAMYGAMLAFPEGLYDNFYYHVAKEKPSPLSEDFDEIYFNSLFNGLKPTLSAKAFLATEQRIPGFGNGVLQDILFHAGVHPKTKIAALTAEDRKKLFSSMKTTLKEMADQGGRDSEKDLFGNNGGYKTLLNSKSAGNPCPKCGTNIVKAAYLGGSVYFCPTCQPM